MDSELIKLAKEIINDKNYDQIHTFIQFVKWRDTIVVPRDGFVYDKKLCKYIIAGYNNGYEFDAVVIISNWNGIYIDKYVYDAATNILVMEKDPNQKYLAMDCGFKISFWEEMYKWHCHYDACNHMTYIVQCSPTHTIIVDIDTSGDINVSVSGNFFTYANKIVNYIHLLKTNTQFIDRFHMAPKSNKK
jgi:hypothetical protein